MGCRRFDGRGEPNHFEHRREGRRSAGLEKLEGPNVAQEAAMVGGVVRFAFGDQGRKLCDARHAQQEHDKQCFPVLAEGTH